MPPNQSPLTAFTPAIQRWFADSFAEPTSPQAEGWPAIQRGEHVLILAPTGSGKTLAAFLWGIDALSRHKSEKAHTPATKDQSSGIRLLYISPLKALNNDVERNLRKPLRDIGRTAETLGLDFPDIKVAVRSGDTPQGARQAMLRTPPDILITTPESLYLMLTSPKAQDLFKSVQTVIVDEIHTLAGNKRGVHLALSLERLQHVARQPVQRIGLSATIRPLDEVARFLGGSEWYEDEKERVLSPRPVTIVDSGYKKPLDLEVLTVVDDFSNLQGGSIWPVLIPRITSLIRQHNTTLIFTNDRRSAERAADRLNAQIAAEAEGRESGLVEAGVAHGGGMFGLGSTAPAAPQAKADDRLPENPAPLPPIRVHHGSISKEARLALERDLKAGKLPALVGTSSLELGIDIGAIDLVVQLRSAKSVAQGLQRVGRSGHLVGQTSRGRIFPAHREEVVEAAAVAGGMLRGEVEPTHTPRQPLDVLAQQIVAMVAVEGWQVEALFDLLRQAYAYNQLTRRVFEAVLDMLSGRYPSAAHRELRARISWDRVNNNLAELPGSRLLAVTNGGTIPNSGAFSAYLADGKTKLGELDEEFVFETRVGDTLLLGSQVWRVIDITDDKLRLTEAPDAVPRMPFWRGDFPWRPYELGQRVGAVRRVVAERLQTLRSELNLAHFKGLAQHADTPAVQAALAWLRDEYALDTASAWHLLTYVGSQLDQSGKISSDRTILVEVFDDPLGDPRMVIHSPFGGRVNGPWGLALTSALRQKTGVEVEVQTNDDGILLRFPDADADFPLDIVTGMGPLEARERILAELPNSAVFGARFRQNAARALLLPGARGGKRTPFWLQRLRAKDLLQVVRQLPDFPIIAETYRDCLEDVLDMPHLEEVLTDIQQGDIEVVVLESLTPSPVAHSLLWDFINIYMYEWDAPKAERQLQSLALNRDLLQDLLKDVALDELLRPEALTAVTGRLQHTLPTNQVRTAEELAILLQNLGDLTSAEIAMRSSSDPAGWIAQLAGQNRIIQLDIPAGRASQARWLPAEYVAEYIAAFDLPAPKDTNLLLQPAAAASPTAARQAILERYLNQAGPVTMANILSRYAFPGDWLRTSLEQLVAERQVAHGRFTPKQAGIGPVSEDEFIDRRTLEQIHRRTLSILRQEVQPLPFPAYVDFLTRWQHLHPAARLAGPGSLNRILQQLRAVPIIGSVWERDVLPLRLTSYDPAELAELCQRGELVWVGSGGVNPRRGRIRFIFRGEGNTYLESAPEELSELGEEAQAVYAFLKSEGAIFFADIQSGVELESSLLEKALIELVMAGLVTNDSLDTLRQMARDGSAIVSTTRPRKPYSSLEAQLAERRLRQPQAGQRSGGFKRPSHSELAAARRRVRQRLDIGPAAPNEETETPRWMGRWAAVHRFGVLGKALPLTEQVRRQTRQLLARYGIVTRDSLAYEIGAWDWGLIYSQLQQLEMRGEIRRGYFVQGLPGVQFALPEAVEQLRDSKEAVPGAQNREENNRFVPDREDNVVVLNACDPANLYGSAVEESAGRETPHTTTGEPLTFARIPSTWLVLWRGWPVLLAEDSARSITTVAGADESLLRQALQALFAHLGGFERRLTVTHWNGEAVLKSNGQPLLESLGGYRDYPGITWEAADNR